MTIRVGPFSKYICMRRELAWHAQWGAEGPISLKHREQEEWSEVSRDHIVNATVCGRYMLGDRNMEVTKTAFNFRKLIFKQHIYV